MVIHLSIYSFTQTAMRWPRTWWARGRTKTEVHKAKPWLQKSPLHCQRPRIEQHQVQSWTQVGNKHEVKACEKLKCLPSPRYQWKQMHLHLPFVCDNNCWLNGAVICRADWENFHQKTKNNKKDYSFNFVVWYILLYRPGVVSIKHNCCVVSIMLFLPTRH